MPPELDIQHDWDAGRLSSHWPQTPDNVFLGRHVANAPVEATAEGACGGRLLEVAAADAEHACRIAKLGLEAFVVEPSQVMLVRARERMAFHGTTVHLVRGIAETLPFPDHVFDRVLCDSALDHLADPERGIREMARVTAPGGRVVLTFVNYGGLTVRASRVLYRIGRTLGLLRPHSPTDKLFWDTPVPYEHNFECTLANVSDMCRSYLVLDHAHGVSLGWAFPGWGPLLERHPKLQRLLPRLDRIAHAHPAAADFVVSVWRVRPRTEWPVDELRVRPTNPVYRRLREVENRFQEASNYGVFFGETHAATAGWRNATFTGDPGRSWIQDLAARGPFRNVAVLGCGDVPYENTWLHANGSDRLDIFERSPGLVRKVRTRLGSLAGRARFSVADLNFVELPEAAYDCIWSSDVLGSVTNLEHLYTQVARALRPGGLFAFHGYVGEPRLQYAPERLAKVNAVLQSVPARFRLLDTIVRPDPTLALSPFQALRSEDILPLARSRFEVVHLVETARLGPLSLVLDMAAIAREDAALLARLEQAEEDARRDPVMRPSCAYAVFRKPA